MICKTKNNVKNNDKCVTQNVHVILEIYREPSSWKKINAIVNENTLKNIFEANSRLFL